MPHLRHLNLSYNNTQHTSSLSQHTYTPTLSFSLSLSLPFPGHANTHTLSLSHTYFLYINSLNGKFHGAATHPLSLTHTHALSLTHTLTHTHTHPIHIQPQRFFLSLDTHTHTHTLSLSHTHILCLTHTPSLSHTLSIYIQPQRQVSWRSSASAHASSTPPQSELQQHSQSRRCSSRRVPLLPFFSPLSSRKALLQIQRAL